MPDRKTATFDPVSLPEPVFYPPFDITRASHLILTVRNLDESLRFYTRVLGLLISDVVGRTAYLRAAEEACHHSLVLKEIEGNQEPACDVLGFRVLTDAELDKAHDWALARALDPIWVDAPFQSRTLRFRDPIGTPLEFCANMPVLERQMGFSEGGLAFAKRLDHYQVHCPDVVRCTEFYVELGFRISDVMVSGDAPDAVFLWRKGSVSDLVLMASPGPRVHHVAYAVRKPDEILRACDLVGELGYPMLTTEEGPGRHGMDGAYYVYFRDPDGHRVELFDGHYQTIDTELEPRQFSPEEAAPPWGRPTLASWFEQATPFTDTPVAPSRSPLSFPTMEKFIGSGMASD